VSVVVNLSDVAANAQANAAAALLNSGTIQIYSGTQPVNANTALSGNTLLATLTLGSTAFGTSVAGVITANPITSGTAVATGTATFARWFEANGTTVVWDEQVGVTGAALNLNIVEIVTGGLVSCTSYAHQVPEQAPT
jgi:glutamate synthase domain-containing protein 3